VAPHGLTSLDEGAPAVSAHSSEQRGAEPVRGGDAVSLLTCFRAAAIDSRLHAERVDAQGGKRPFQADLDRLPSGVFVTLPGQEEQAWLLWGDWLLAWSPGGYGERRTRPLGVQVAVLTPGSTVEVIRAGYVPGLDSSAGLS